MVKLVLSPPQAAAALGVTSGTLATWRRASTGPAYIRLGYPAIGYQIADLEQWVASRRASEGRPS